MKSYIFLLVLGSLLVTSLTEARQRRFSNGRRQGHLPMQNPDLFQGDILLKGDQDYRNAIVDERLKWPGKTVHYTFDSSLWQSEINEIIKGMNAISRQTCIKFEPRTTQKNYIHIFPGDGCYSYVGMINIGAQEVSIGDGCVYIGTIVHELMHAIGFDHEHCRSDRDDYLIIYWQNILEGDRDQFDKLNEWENLLLGPFDYDSVMLYGEDFFSKDGYSKTMAARDGRRLKDTYNKPGLSTLDASKMNKLYKC